MSSFNNSENSLLISIWYTYPLHLPFLPGEPTSIEFDGTLVNTYFKIQLHKHHFRRAQLRKKQVDEYYRSDKHFEVGDWLYFKVQPYIQETIVAYSFHKLAAKYYGPSQVLKRVYTVANTLLFPSSVKIHSTVHVSLLTKFYEIPSQISYTRVVDLANPQCPNPKLLLQRRMVKKDNKVVAQFLIK